MKKIGYLMSRFPHLPETFILREMSELERQGFEVALYPLIFQTQTVIHDEAKDWVPRARRSGFMSAAILLENLRVLLTRPALYLSLWFRVFTGNLGSISFLWRALVLVPQAVHTAKQMVEEGVDHVHAHYATHPALVAWIIHQLTGLTYSVTVHAHDIFVERAMLAEKLRDASFVVAISDFNRRFLMEQLGDWVGEKIRVIHCGIPATRFMPRPLAVDAEQDPRFTVVSIGSLQPYKGQKYLVQACDVLVKRGIPVQCLIVGEGEERSALEEEIARLKLEDHVRLLGARTQDDISALLPRSDCYAQPSVIASNGKMEGIPVSIMEALACELPVIATAISGIPELVVDGQTGLLVEPENPPALAEALAYIYDHRDRAVAMAKAGRELVLDEFNLEPNVRQLASLFRG